MAKLVPLLQERISLYHSLGKAEFEQVLALRGRLIFAVQCKLGGPAVRQGTPHCVAARNSTSTRPPNLPLPTHPATPPAAHAL